MNQNLNPLLSITAKLFYFTTVLVLTTAATVAIRTNIQLRDVTNLYTNDKLNNTVEKTTTATIRVLLEWEGAIKTAFYTLKDEPGNRARSLDKLVGANPDYVGLAIYQVKNNSLTEVVSSLSTRKDNVYIKTLDLKKFHADIKQKAQMRLAEEIKKRPKAGRLLINLYDTLGQPVILMAYGSADKSRGVLYYGVLLAWQTQLFDAIDMKEVIDAKPLMLGAGGAVLISTETKDYTGGGQKEFAAHPLWRQATEKDNDSGVPTFLKNYEFKHMKWNGSYQKIGPYDLLVVIQQDVRVTEEAGLKLLKSSGLLSLFIALIGMFFAYFGATGLTANLKSVIEITRKIAAGDFTASLVQKSRDEIGELSESVNLMASQILELLQSQVQQARMEKELETATLVQETIFPQQTIVSGPITISGFNNAASECGGDWWGSFSAGEGIEYIFIADAMGHGVPAALVTAMAYATCTTLGSIIMPEDRKNEIAAILERLNEVIYNAVRGRISMSFFALMIDYKKGMLTYANAGHNFPLLLPMLSGDDRVKKKVKQEPGQIQPISLRVTGNILGITKKETYTEKSMELRAGDKIFLFTDGLIECKNPEGSSWGARGLNERLAQYAACGPEELNQRIVEDLYTFFNGTPQDDDITVIVAEVSKDCRFAATPKFTMPA